MEKNSAKIKLTHSLPAKVGAIMLLTALSAVTICAAIVVAASIDAQWYTYGFNGMEFSQYVNLALFAYNMRNWAIVITIAGFVLAVVAFVFLCASAGHRGETDEVRLNHMDKIPLDIYFAAVLLAVAALGNIAVDSGYYSGVEAVIVSFSICGLFIGLLSLAFILSFVTRIKVGGWWRNTVIYMILRLCWRIIKAVWRWCVNTVLAISTGLPIVWRTAIITLLALFLNFVLTLMIRSGGLWLPLWFLFNLFIFSSLCFGAMQMKSLKAAGRALAAGDFDYKIDTSKMYWEFKNHGENLNSIGNGMALAVNQRIKSERLKTELITNVSHDIKTPLTSIVSYVDLLQKPHTDQEESDYLEVLARQSRRLKKLTEDLVEASKASTGNMSVNLLPVNTAEIIGQSAAEYADRLALGKLELVVNTPEPPISVMADGRLLWRVMDNLFNNVCKYGLAGTRVYADVRREGETAVISLKNISRAALNVSAEELMERFVRGDSSRNTEGSGLGLNIAKSLTELQKGRFNILTDGDLFKAEIVLPIAL